MAKRMFEIDALVPSQFFERVGKQAPSRKGEYRLLIAVLEDAVECFQENALTGDHQFAEAEHWIMGTDASCHGDAAAPRLSFEYICAVLDLDPDYLRLGLRRWREAAFAKADRAQKAGQ